MQNILITGGTGLVGTQLTQLLLSKGYGVHIFTRKASLNNSTAKLKFFEWNPKEGIYDKSALENVTAIVNLAGAGIADKRWTTKRKEEIKNSRQQSGNTITKILLENKHNVQVLVQASAIGWYKANTKSNGNTEEEEANTDYLGQTCKAWEESIASLKTTSLRVVTLRIGIVLDQHGGMVKELLLPMHFGVLPVFGNGKQIVPWIHNDDLSALFLLAIQQDKLVGTYNAVASNTDTQKSLVKRIAKTLHKKWFIALPIPAFLLKMMLGEMSVEILKSSVIDNTKIKKAGFTFQYPALENIDRL